MHIRPTYRDANPLLPAGRKLGRITRKMGRVNLLAARHIRGTIFFNVAKYSFEKPPNVLEVLSQECM
jgi:hypothetical protein